MLQLLGIVLGEIFNKSRCNCFVRFHKNNRCFQSYTCQWNKALRHQMLFRSLPWLQIFHLLGKHSPRDMPFLLSPNHSSNQIFNLPNKRIAREQLWFNYTSESVGRGCQFTGYFGEPEKTNTMPWTLDTQQLRQDNSFYARPDRQGLLRSAFA